MSNFTFPATLSHVIGDSEKIENKNSEQLTDGLAKGISPIRCNG